MKRITSIVLTTLLSTGVTFAMANNSAHQISLRATPSKDAKVIAEITPSQRLIPIFQQNGWTKVGNPENGIVGWVKTNKLTQNENHSSQQSQHIESIRIPHYSQTVITAVTGKDGKTTYKVYETGNHHKITQADARQLFNRMEKQQQIMQQHFNRIMRENFAAFNQPFFNNHFFGPQYTNFIPPVEIIVEPPKNEAALKPIQPHSKPNIHAISPKPTEKN